MVAQVEENVDKEGRHHAARTHEEHHQLLVRGDIRRHDAEVFGNQPVAQAQVAQENRQRQQTRFFLEFVSSTRFFFNLTVVRHL